MAHTKSTRFVPPPLVFTGMWFLQHRLSRGRRPRPATTAAAAALAAGGGLLGMSAVGALERRGTPIDPKRPGETHTLVTDGPFARTRNPMYLALAVLLASHALYHRSPRAMLPAAGFMAVVSRTQIPREERALHARFRGKYARYARQTPRWMRRPDRAKALHGR